MTVGPMDFTDDPAREALHADLLAWFDANARDLPWRRRRSLYGTWISEMMLQQTTVATATPYWERFLERFPDVRALAAASEEEVLAHWSGLGYYRRARQLHAAARQVVSDHGGVLPVDVDGWRRLPGVGPYAAGAIASLALGHAEPAVDANVRRVLGRWLAGAGDASPPAGRILEDLARRLVCPRRPGAWNEALMELGALVCQARNPRCGSCPVARHCAAGRAGVIPGPCAGTARQAPVPADVLLVAFLSENRVWLERPGEAPIRCATAAAPAREALGDLHRGLLTLPTTAWYHRADVDAGGLLGRLEEGWGATAGFPGHGSPREAGRFRHAITRFRLTVQVATVRLDPGAAGPTGRTGRWADLLEAPGLNISQLARKALRLIADGRG